MSEKIQVDGYRVIEEYLLTKGEGVVSGDMKILFRPLIDFGIIVYNLKINATNRMAMKFDLEKFFMRKCSAEISGADIRYVKVPKDIYDRVKKVNDGYRQNS